jgi:hypothetical protein
MRIFIPCVLVPLACAGVYPAAADAQIQPAPSPRAFCAQGAPGESCRAFLVVEGNAYAVLAGSTYRRTGYGPGEVTQSRHLTGHAAVEAGAMTNLGARDAIGAAFLLGGDANGIRLALKARYRRWLDRGAALDAGAGMMIARRAEPYADPDRPGNFHVAVSGVTGDVALGLTEWASVSVRGDLLVDDDGQRATALYGGVKLGTRPTAAGVAIPLLFAAILGLVTAGAS